MTVQGEKPGLGGESHERTDECRTALRHVNHTFRLRDYRGATRHAFFILITCAADKHPARQGHPPGRTDEVWRDFRLYQAPIQP